MRPRSSTALRASTALLLVYGLLVPCAPRAGAQSTDGTHWSIFAGHTISSAAGSKRSFGFPSENFGVGASVELEPWRLPVPLRATLAYDKFRWGPTTTLKATSLMVDAMFRPTTTVRGIRPYLLGGLGIATVSPSAVQLELGGAPYAVPLVRTTAFEWHAGIGLEAWRFFVEYQPSPHTLYGGHMPSRSATRLGFRF